ncbi:hypothetical protein D7I39_20265 [Allopusillimonas ginsengisoli]|nr:hypothetical protein D7I39_20265 [Allopusillimonas ginsengisoli]
MFQDLIDNLNVYSHSCTERLDQFVLNIKVVATPSTVADYARRAVSCVRKISQRDRCDFSVEICGDEMVLGDDSQEAEDGLVESILRHDDEESETVLTVRINKHCVNSILSLYDVVAFGQYLKEEKLRAVLLALATRFSQSGFLCFEVQGEFLAAGSDTIRFFGSVDRAGECRKSSVSLRENVINLFRENSYGSSELDSFIPSDFWMHGATGVENIDRFMASACAVLSAVFLSNVSELLADDTLRYKVAGYKSLENGAVTAAELAAVRDILYMVYRWAYVDGTADKLGLARNIISLHATRLEALTGSDEVMNALHSNYQIYLKGNVATYLELKGKIADMVADSTTKTYTMVDELLDSVKNSVFLVVTFLLTVVLISGFKDAGPEMIFSAGYLAVVSILTVVLSLWVAMNCWEALGKFDSASVAQRELLQRSFGQIILPEEIDQSFEPTRCENRRYLKDQLFRYLKWWGVIGIVFVAAFVIGYCVFDISSTAVSEEALIVQPVEQTPSLGGSALEEPRTDGVRGQRFIAS